MYVITLLELGSSFLELLM